MDPGVSMNSLLTFLYAWSCFFALLLHLQAYSVLLQDLQSILAPVSSVKVTFFS